MERIKRNLMLIIFGPTGVGKTDLALNIAQYIPAEIVNMDVGQFYTPFSIGTAKPAWQTLPVKHHFFDILDEPKDYTVVDYRKRLLALLPELWDRKVLPIIVGGSGFYLRTLFFPPRGGSANFVLDKNSSDLWNMLHVIDPIRAAAIQKNDTYRIKRALDIWYATRQVPSQYNPIFDPPADCIILFLTRNRIDLYERINKRVFMMFGQGWLDEVKGIQNTAWEPFLKKKKLIGYDDFLNYLEGPQTAETLAETLSKIQQKTRSYAKRQCTFWRMFEKQIHALDELNLKNTKIKVESVDLTLMGLDLYIKKLLNTISSF